MDEILTGLGWDMYYECNCPGGKRRHYSHKEKAGYEVVVKEKAQTFTLLLNNQAIAGPKWHYELTETLTKHVQ